MEDTINSKTFTSPRLNYEEIESLNGPIISGEIESAVKAFPLKKDPGQHDQLREDLTPIDMKLFQK